jgi:hypothetical protein
MSNDAKLGLVVGVGLVIAIGVIFFRKEPPATEAVPAASAPGSLRPMPAKSAALSDIHP